MYKYFTKDELKCKCGCGKADMDDEFMTDIVNIREKLAIPLIVTSAYRCPEYNNEVSSTGLTGPHTTGRAIDIKADARLKYKLLDQAEWKGFSRIGIGKSFIHLDDLGEEDGFSEEVVWTY